MRVSVLSVAVLVSLSLAPTGLRGKDKPDKLPGAKGPLWEYVGKAGVKVTGADVGVGVSDPKPEKPPKNRMFPSGTKSLRIAVQFERKPVGSSVTVETYNKEGKVQMAGGVVLQIENTRTGSFTLQMGLNPKAGTFDDGPYQGQVKLDGKVIALVNWEIGAPGK
jgi:hypothetical protein